MKTLKWLTICLVACCLFTGNVFAQFHGISFLKQTGGSASVGDPVPVSFLILNSVDQCQDTLEVYSLVDVLQTSGGPVSSGEILSTLNWQFQNGAGWNDPVAKNYIILPFGGIATSDPYSYYNVQPGDVALGELIDQANLGWTDTCEGGLNCGNCATNPEVASASGATTVIGEPCFEVTKECLSGDTQLQDGDLAEYLITITNCGDVPLDYQVTDAQDPSANGLYGPHNPGGPPILINVSIPVQCGPEGYILNEVEVLAIGPGDVPVESTTEQPNPRIASAQCPCGNVGEEGCTPGFWKNHPDCWCESYLPTMLVSDVWTALQDPIYDSFDGDTLMDALNYGGGRGLDGKVRNMLRHAVAALLNGCNGDVAFPISDAVVIELGNAALATQDVDIIQELHGVLAEWNEYGCPINAHCELEYPEENGVIVD